MIFGRPLETPTEALDDYVIFIEEVFHLHR